MSNTLVIYVHYPTKHSIKNLIFFDKFGLYKTRGVTYILVINENKNNSISMPDLSERWSLIMHRANEGYDFLAWDYALKNVNLDKFKYFIFLNDTVIGPYVDRNWIDTFTNLISKQNKLAGLTINCHNGDYIEKEYGVKSVPHVQSMFWVVDRQGLDIVKPIISDATPMNKLEIIVKKEIAMSMKILEAGFNITCILPPYQVDYRKAENRYINQNNGAHGDPWFIDAYFGRTLSPMETIFFKNNRIQYQDLYERQQQYVKFY